MQLFLFLGVASEMENAIFQENYWIVTLKIVMNRIQCKKGKKFDLEIQDESQSCGSLNSSTIITDNSSFHPVQIPEHLFFS